jgi:hypothetical protein
MPRATVNKSSYKIHFFESHFQMQTSTLISRALADFSEPKSIPYSSEAIRRDVERLRCAWVRCQRKRRRDAIHKYLSAVYDLVSWWATEGVAIKRSRRALGLHGLNIPEKENPFAAIIRCTADPCKVDKRTRSKWSRVMRYAEVYKDDAEPLKKFVQRKGGINACATRFSRCLLKRPKTRGSLRTY